MTKSRIFLFFVASFLYGIFLSVYFWIFSLCFFVLFVVFRRWGSWFALICVLIGVVLGSLYWFLMGFSNNVHYEEGQVYLERCISSEVDVRDDEVRYVFGDVLVNAARYPVYKYGDCLIITGKLYNTDLSDSYGRYLARYGIYAVVYNPQLSLLDYRLRSPFMNFIYSSKSLFEGRMREIFTEPFAGFLGGLLLGSRGGIGDELLAKFSHIGLTHIIAISGYNITIIVNALGIMFGFLGKRERFFVSVLFIFIFVILVGASASVIRAALMGSISLMAILFERQYFCFLALVFSAFIMSLFNPKILVYDVGFQLSFLATFGMVLFTSRLEKYFSWVPDRFFLRENLVVTMSAQIFTVPLILLYFGRFSPASIVANLFVLPFIPWAMLFGFLSVVSSFVWYGFGVFVGSAAFLCLKIIILFVDIFDSLY